MRPTLAVFYGDASGGALVDAIRRWRKEFAPGHAYEGLVGGPIKMVKVQTSIYEAGHFRVHVRIEGRRQGGDEDYWYDATLAAGELKLSYELD